MVTKKRKSTKTKTRTRTKKDLETKIAQLESKLANLSAQVGSTAKAQTAPPPPPPKPAQQAPPKPAEQTAPSKPAEQKAAPPATLSQALENAWESYPMSNTHDFKKKVTGFSPNPNRYFGRRIAPQGTTQTYDWNLQKEKVTGYTACSNQYFATRARMCYHPADKTFTGYGLQIEGATAQTESAPPPPQPQVEAQPEKFTSPKNTKEDKLAAYEAEYLERLARQDRENAEIQRAAEEIAAKRQTESGGSAGSSSTKGSLPKGF